MLESKKKKKKKMQVKFYQITKPQKMLSVERNPQTTHVYGSYAQNWFAYDLGRLAVIAASVVASSAWKRLRCFNCAITILWSLLMSCDYSSFLSLAGHVQVIMVWGGERLRAHWTEIDINVKNQVQIVNMKTNFLKVSLLLNAFAILGFACFSAEYYK